MAGQTQLKKVNILTETWQKNLTPDTVVTIAANGDLEASPLGSIGSLGYYNVKNYGATGDGVTDDTLSIQSVIDLCYANGGGVIYFPNGVYIVGGELVTTDNTGKNPNAQLYIPSGRDVSVGGTETAKVIKFLGETPPSMNASGFVDDFIPSMDNGVLIKSTLPYASVSGTLPCVFGGKGDNISYPFNLVDVMFENIWVRTHHDPTHGTYLTAINGSQWSFTTYKTTRVDIDVAGWNSVESDSLCFGIIGVGSSGGTTNIFENTLAYGYKVGQSFGEHGVLNNATSYFCTWGFDCQKAGHSSTIYHALSQWNKYSFSFNKYDRGYVSAFHFVNNYGMVVENIDAGKWYDADVDVDDPDNGIWGNMFFSKTISGTPPYDDNRPITKNGGENLNCKHIARFITTYEKDKSLLVDVTANPSVIPALKVKGSNDVYTSIDVFGKDIPDGQQLKIGQFANGNVLISNEGNSGLRFYTNGVLRLAIAGNGNPSFSNEVTAPAATVATSLATLGQVGGLVENLTSTPFTAGTLNSTYPSAITGFRVLCPHVGTGTIYTKTSAGWIVLTGTIA